MHGIKWCKHWEKVSPTTTIYIILVDSEVIVDLEGEVQDSVYIFLGPPAPQEATSVGAQDKDGGPQVVQLNRLF